MKSERWAEDLTVGDRQMMLRALARYSDECEAPDLTPDCPFFEVIESGPVCGEQCQDVLAKYPQDHVDPDLLGLGGGLSARRRMRPRRGPPADERAYDAAQIRLEDRDKPLSEQRLGALVGALSLRAMGDLEQDSDHVDLGRLLEELERRGLQIREIARLGLTREFGHGVGLSVWASQDAGATDVLPARFLAAGEVWRQTLEEVPGTLADSDSDGGGQRVLTLRGVNVLSAWFGNTPVETSLSGHIPTAAELRADMSFDADADLVIEAEWLFDRFTKTYTPDWRVRSLRREWRYLHAHLPGCCPPGMMRQRPMESSDVSMAIADADCNRSDTETADARQPSLSKAQLKRLAFDAAMDGRHEHAAGIFQVVSRLDPSDGESTNNLGFCLIPTRAKEAADTLRAARESTSTPTLTDLNLSLALHLAGDATAGLEQALVAVAEAPDDLDQAWVWHLGDGGLRLELVHDLLDYGIDLIDHMERCPGSCVGPELDLGGSTP